MTWYLGPEHVRACLDHQVAYDAIVAACRFELDGRTQLPARLDVPSRKGFLRVMPAVLDDVMGLKIMTLVEGVGTRYLVVLCSVETGAVLALFDADELTRLRTGAVSALAGRLLAREPPRRVGLIGSGFEAIGQLRALAWLWPLEEVFVYSPQRERRRQFATAMTTELGLEVTPVPSAAAAVAHQAVVVLATKSKEPVLNGADLERGAVVLSIGSTRLDLRELDETTLARAAVLVGDDPEQLLSESGDVRAGVDSSAVGVDRMVSLASLCAGHTPATRRDDGRDLLVFKSVGTAIQDLAVAKAALGQSGRLAAGARDLGDLATLKPFSDGAGKLTPERSR